MDQIRHHNRVSSSMGDGDDGVSSATPSTHRPYIFMQSCTGPPQFDSMPHHTSSIPAAYHHRTSNIQTAYPMEPMDAGSMPKPISSSSNIMQHAPAATATTAATSTSTTAAPTTSIMQQRVHPQTNVIYKVSSRPLTPDYAKSYPVMDTTVASSVKGEPELNIGKKNTMLLAMLSLPNLSPQAL